MMITTLTMVMMMMIAMSNNEEDPHTCCRQCCYWSRLQRCYGEQVTFINGSIDYDDDEEEEEDTEDYYHDDDDADDGDSEEYEYNDDYDDEEEEDADGVDATDSAGVKSPPKRETTGSMNSQKPGQTTDKDKRTLPTKGHCHMLPSVKGVITPTICDHPLRPPQTTPARPVEEKRPGGFSPAIRVPPGRTITGSNIDGDNTSDTETMSDKDKDLRPEPNGSDNKSSPTEGTVIHLNANGAPPVLLRGYRKTAITNRDDNKIRQRLDDADNLLVESEFESARDAFKELMYSYKHSPRAHYGYAQALDKMSEKRQSNGLLEAAIDAYEKVLNLPHVPETLYLLVADRFVDRARFRGFWSRALKIQDRLVHIYPNNFELLNNYGITFLMMGRNADAKRTFKDIIMRDPENHVAQAHYGFILKVVDNDVGEGVKYLRSGVTSNAMGTQDARFYFHLGDGLQRLGQNDEAYKIYEQGANNGLFISKYQRSLYNVIGLTSQPFWELEDTGHEKALKDIQKHWRMIRDEAIDVMDGDTGLFQTEDENLTEKGDWKQLTIYRRGNRVTKNCERTPKTCQLLESFPEATTCTRGQIKFSIMQPGVRVHPHCGPTNCRLRAHLGLVVPPEPRIRVADRDPVPWVEGEFLIFDDSFEHEVWHDGSGFRLVLIVDFWHPELTESQKRALAPL